MHIPILTELQNGRVSRWENGHIWVNNVHFKLNFQDEGHLDVNFFFFILFIANSLVVAYEYIFSS